MHFHAIIFAALSLKCAASVLYEPDAYGYSPDNSRVLKTSTTVKTGPEKSKSSRTSTHKVQTHGATSAYGSTSGQDSLSNPSASMPTLSSSIHVTLSSARSVSASLHSSQSASVSMLSAQSSSKLPLSTATPTASSRLSSGTGQRSTIPSSGTGQLSSTGASRRSTKTRSSASGSVSYISISGCPPIPATTRTITQSADIYLATERTTLGVSYINATFYETAYQVSYEYTTLTSYTATATLDSTVTLSPDATTVTQPTPPGFTPVSCNALYHVPVVTTYTGPTIQQTYTITDQTADPALGYTLTATTFLANTTVTVTSSVKAVSTTTNIRTITKTSQTSTIWAACATNNVVAEFPYGGFNYWLGAWNSVNNSPTNPDTVRAGVTASGPIDCCASCQANGTCAGSAWDVFGQSCTLFILKAEFSDTCDPTEEGEVSGVPTYDFPRQYLSNSGCGQWHFFNFDSSLA